MKQRHVVEIENTDEGTLVINLADDLRHAGLATTGFAYREGAPEEGT